MATTPSDERPLLIDVEQGTRARYGTDDPGPKLSRKAENARIAKRIKYYIPSTSWIPNYSLSLYVHSPYQLYTNLTSD